MSVAKRALRAGPAGTARDAFAGFPVTNIPIAGKTGTAELTSESTQLQDAWFVSYAKQSDGTSPVAVAVLVDPEDMDITRSEIAGGKLGAPIAKAVMQAVLKKS